MLYASAHPVMETTSKHTVFGFNYGLDWRPTSFVDALPSAYVCSVCGLVPRLSAALPCGHVLCLQCYNHNGSRLNCCPLDKKIVDEKGVVFSSLSRESILSRKVRCWNAENGCVAEDAASAMLEHFFSHCQFHPVSCRTCGIRVLRRDVVNHVASRCPGPSSRQSPDEHPFLSVVEVEEVLKQISSESATAIARQQSLEERRMREKEIVMTELSLAVADMVRVEQYESALRTYGTFVSARELLNTATANEPAASARLEPSTTRGDVKDKARATSLEDLVQSCSISSSPLESAKGAIVGTSMNNEVKEAPAEPQTVPRKRLDGRPEPFSRRLVRADDRECCECIIENWTHFSTGQAPPDIREGRCDCGTRLLSYGYILVPELIATSTARDISFSVYAFKGLDGATSDRPSDGKFTIRLIHPTDSSRELIRSKEMSWYTPPFPERVRGQKVHCLGYIPSFISVACVEEGGFVANDELRMRFRLTPW
ncbi:uncharacterized protein [Dermacentor albipictus]|uniref:uncharacterized protein n=1 Tax=Dermacentor albipictus TaxID=60249 RepID=UPI0038FCD17A